MLLQLIIQLILFLVRINGENKLKIDYKKTVDSINFEHEFTQFLITALQKMGNPGCLAIIADSNFTQKFATTPFCSDTHFCPEKFIVTYNGGKLNSKIKDSLSEANKRDCGGYMILFSHFEKAVEIFTEGDSKKILNTRAKYLIWYENSSEKLEKDKIWKKFVNAILFKGKIRKTLRSSYLTFSIIGFKWPIPESLSEPTLRKIEFWRNGTLNKNELWYYNKLKDFKASTLKILIVNHPPGVIKFSFKGGYGGIEIEILKVLSNAMNFNYEFIDADPTTKWGGQNKSSNKYFGGFAVLANGEADMGIGSFFTIQKYLKKVDMSVPLDVVCTSFLTPNPSLRSRYLALLYPFQSSLWALVILSFMITVPILVLFSASSRNKEILIFSGKSEATLTTFSVMCQVGLPSWPKFGIVRFIFISYWFFWICITLGYKCAMVSFLTIPLFEKPINNLLDLHAYQIRFGGWGIEHENLFKQTISHQSLSIKDSLLEKYETIEDIDEGISNVAEGKFALYENKRFLKFIRSTRNISRSGSPSMRIMKQCIVPIHIGFAYERNSILTFPINKHIRRFQESGLMKKWGQRLIALTKEDEKMRNTNATENNSDGEEENENEEAEEGDEESDAEGEQKNSKREKILDFQDLQGSFYIILFGTILSVGAFSFELLINKKINPLLKTQFRHQLSLYLKDPKREKMKQYEREWKAFEKRFLKKRKKSCIKIKFPYIE